MDQRKSKPRASCGSRFSIPRVPVSFCLFLKGKPKEKAPFWRGPLIKGRPTWVPRSTGTRGICPHALQAYRYDAEVNERNAPMTDEDRLGIWQASGLVPCAFMRVARWFFQRSAKCSKDVHQIAAGSWFH